MKKSLKRIFGISAITFAAFFLFVLPAYPGDAVSDKKNPFNYFKDHEIDVFPIPVWESRPDEGNTYGLMPVVLMSDHDKQIKAIFAAIGQYNSVAKVSGGALAYFYPKADQAIEIYAEVAQKYLRDVEFHFIDSSFFDRQWRRHKFHLEGNFVYLKTPFGRFFGLGPQRVEDNQSNFTGRNFLLDTAFGYYFLKNIRAELAVKFHTTDILDRAIEDIDDTLDRYGGLPNVVDSTNLINEFAFVFDNRKDKEYSTSGSKVRLAWFLSNKALGSDKNFQGWKLEAIHLIPLVKNRWTTAFRFNFQEIFGTRTPFFELSSLGGADEFRAFTPGRFVDQGKIVFQIEQRIKVFDWRLFGIPFEIHTDPFFEVGRVFNAVSNLGFNFWQPVGGVGFRLFVPPNIIGRLDVAAGSDGIEIYTELGYPF